MDDKLSNVDSIEYSEKRADEEFNALSEILHAARSTAKAVMKTKPIDNAIKSSDREQKIKTLVEHIQKYSKLINLLKPITGREVIYEVDFYIEKTDSIINTDLKFIKNIIYVDEAKNYGLEKVAHKALQAIFNKYAETKKDER